MKRALLFIAASIVAVLCAVAESFTPAQVPDVHRADRNAFVADPSRAISAQATATLNSQLQAMRRSLTIEPMVVVLPAIDDPSDPSQFATELFGLWGLGKSDLDNGLLILVVLDTHKITIRPGYGLEGALPDITCGRIIRDVMAPRFREDDYGQGLIDAVTTINEILSNPEIAEEYRSSEADSDHGEDISGDDIFKVWLGISAVVALLMLLVFLTELYSVRGADDYKKYTRLSGLKNIYLILSALGIGIPLVATIPLILCLQHWRNRPRKCPNCGTPMVKLDEVTDNKYLTPAQDLEEQLGSVDYDVWLCPDCSETDIYPYPNSSSPYKECPRCHARTYHKVRDRILRQPTPVTAGQGVTEYRCVNCNHSEGIPFKIPATGAAALAAGAALGSRGHGGGFSGGGSFGGGFGGGFTGGGGATGGW